jgi:hypothetical protein
MQARDRRLADRKVNGRRTRGLGSKAGTAAASLPRMRTASILLLLLLAGTAAAQTVAPAATALPTAGPFHGVFVSDPYEDGSIWARGDRYKLGLDARGAHFQPLFGPRAPRDYPLSLELTRVGAGGEDLALAPKPARRTATHRLEVDHGAVVERWDLEPGRAEQSFVFAARPGRGEIMVEMALRTDLVLQPRTDGALFFAAPGGLGSVRLGDAVAVDARGRTLPLVLECDGQRLLLRVPAAFADDAAFPLVVDPFLGTLAVDQSVSDMKNARVDYEPTHDVWLVVMEEHLSATDVDIVCRRYAGTSTTPLDTVYAANSPQLTRNPDVGCLQELDKFIVGWSNTTGSAGNGSFEFRIRDAASTTQSGTGETHIGAGGNAANTARIGGAISGDRWLLVTFEHTATSMFIRASQYDERGVAFDHVFVQFILATGSVVGEVSTLRDANDHWCIVWSECGVRCAVSSLMLRALAGTPVSGGASMQMQPLATLASGSLDLQPSIAGFGGNLLAAWPRYAGGAVDIHGCVIGAPGGVFQAISPVMNLTQLEPNANVGASQDQAAVSFDGVRFLCAYSEDDAITRTVRAATILPLGTGVAFHEGHELLATLPAPAAGRLDAAGTCVPPSTRGLHAVVWEQPNALGDGDVLGAFVDAREPGATSVVDQTGCGLQEPGISLAGTPALGRSITVSLQGTVGLPFVVAGASSINLLPGCNGCRSGVDLSSSIAFFGSSLQLALPPSGAFLGIRLAFQGIDLGAPGGCPSNVFGAAFALTDTFTIQIR